MCGWNDVFVLGFLFSSTIIVSQLGAENRSAAHSLTEMVMETGLGGGTSTFGISTALAVCVRRVSRSCSEAMDFRFV